MWKPSIGSDESHQITRGRSFKFRGSRIPDYDHQLGPPMELKKGRVGLLLQKVHGPSPYSTALRTVAA
jgi:hypothetical protein